MPVNTINLGFAEKLEELARKCRVTLAAQRERERENAMRRVMGPLFQVDENTGEVVGEGAGK